MANATKSKETVKQKAAAKAAKAAGNDSSSDEGKTATELGYAELQRTLGKMMSDLNALLAETQGASGLESAEQVRLGCAQFLSQANEVLQQARELVESTKADAATIRENMKKMETAKEYIDQRSIEVRALEERVKQRAAKIERVAEELEKDIGGKL